jgi:hypothetical protein
MLLKPASVVASCSARAPEGALGRLSGLGFRLLLPLLAVTLLACGSDPATRTPVNEGSDDDGQDQPDKTDTDHASGADAGGGQAPAKVDAGGKKPTQPGTPDDQADAGKTPSQGGRGDDAGSATVPDGGSKPGDAGTSSEGPDAGSGPSTPPGNGDTTIPMTIPPASNGAGEIRPSTTVLKGSQSGGKDVWDFENKKIGVNNPVDCEGGEGQVTVFEVEDGVTVKNLIIAGGKPGGNGIVCKGSCTLDHVYWEDICEDAATNSKDGATMTLDHVIALHASDKVFQHNAKSDSKTVIRNSYVSDFGKLWRSCGDCEGNGGPRHLEIDNVRVEGIKTTVAGANRNYKDTVTVKNLYVKGGYDAAKDKPKICQEYTAVTNHQGESTKIDDGKSQWNTATCKLSLSDVKSY